MISLSALVRVTVEVSDMEQLEVAAAALAAVAKAAEEAGLATLKAWNNEDYKKGKEEAK